MTQHQPEHSACPFAATRPHLGVMGGDDTPKACSWRPVHSFTSVWLPSLREKHCFTQVGRWKRKQSLPKKKKSMLAFETRQNVRRPQSSSSGLVSDAANSDKPPRFNYDYWYFLLNVGSLLLSRRRAFHPLFAICKLALQKRLFFPPQPVGFIWFLYDVTQTGARRGERTDVIKREFQNKTSFRVLPSMKRKWN